MWVNFVTTLLGLIFTPAVMLVLALRTSMTIMRSLRLRTSGGVWQAQEKVTDINADQFSPSIAVDYLDNVHVVWYGTGWGTNTAFDNIEYRMRTISGVWQSLVGLTDLVFNEKFPVLIWAEWPDAPTVRTDVPKTGYALVYSF